jgi:hypothetical protein
MTDEVAPGGEMEHTWREELAWSAGFVDGEGSFHSGTYRPIFGCPQVDPRVLERLQSSLLGLGKIYGPYERVGRKPIWRFQVTGTFQVQAVVALLWEFLSEIKRDQAVAVCRNIPRR